MRKTKTEYDREYRARMLVKGWKMASYWMPIPLIEEVRQYIKDRATQLGLRKQ